jgi:hypothetical protein
VKLVLSGALIAALAVGATLLAVRSDDPQPQVAAPPLAAPHAPVIDAAQIASGRVSMERMPAEVGKALETHSEEIVRNAEAIAAKQARITGTCAPGSAIRIIAEDGTVRCQQLPHGVISVAAISAVPRLSSAVTEVAVLPGGVGRYQSGGEDDYLVAPIALPEGAIVTAMSYVFLDDDPVVDTAAFLYRSDDKPLASVSSAGASGQVRVESTESIVLRKVEATRYAYVVYFQVSAKAGSRILPISASVTYRLP